MLTIMLLFPFGGILPTAPGIRAAPERGGEFVVSANWRYPVTGIAVWSRARRVWLWEVAGNAESAISRRCLLRLGEVPDGFQQDFPGGGGRLEPVGDGETVMIKLVWIADTGAGPGRSERSWAFRKGRDGYSAVAIPPGPPEPFWGSTPERTRFLEHVKKEVAAENKGRMIEVLNDRSLNAGRAVTARAMMEVSGENDAWDAYVVLRAVRSLDLSDRGLSDISPVGDLTQLRWLYIQRNHVCDISACAALKHLEILDISGNRVEDVTPLEGLSMLNYLAASDNRVVELRPLAGLHRMRNLYLARNRIREVEALRGMTSLSQLDLTDNQIRDVSPICGKRHLWDIGVGGNKIERAAPLVEHFRLVSAAAGDLGSSLVISGNPLRDPESLDAEWMRRVVLSRD